MWVSQDDDLEDSSSSSSPTLVLLQDMHVTLVADYDCRDTPPRSQPGVRARLGRSSQDGDSQEQEAGPLFLPQLTRLHDRVALRCQTLSPKKKMPPTSVLWYKPMAWLGVIRADRRDEGWSGILSQTFFALTGSPVRRCWPMRLCHVGAVGTRGALAHKDQGKDTSGGP